MQKWIVDNADRVIEAICSETGKAYEDAQIAELSYGRVVARFLVEERAQVPRP
jgi:hypothetical protein